MRPTRGSAPRRTQEIRRSGNTTLKRVWRNPPRCGTTGSSVPVRRPSASGVGPQSASEWKRGATKERCCILDVPVWCAEVQRLDVCTFTFPPGSFASSPRPVGLCGDVKRPVPSIPVALDRGSSRQDMCHAAWDTGTWAWTWTWVGRRREQSFGQHGGRAGVMSASVQLWQRQWWQ